MALERVWRLKAVDKLLITEERKVEKFSVPKVYLSITRQKTFSLLRFKGKKIYFKGFLVSYLRDEQGDGFVPKLGIIVSKKVSAKAVVRNKIKRRFRALFLDVVRNCDLHNYTIVIVALKGVDELSFADLQIDFRRAFRSIVTVY